MIHVPQLFEGFSMVSGASDWFRQSLRNFSHAKKSAETNDCEWICSEILIKKAKEPVDFIYLRDIQVFILQGYPSQHS